MQQTHATQTAPSYHLPLITICEQMRATHATLSLTTILPPSLPLPGRPEGEEIIAEVAFEQGKIIHCQLYIRANGRVLMQHREALHVLHTASMLLWQESAHQDMHVADAETSSLPAVCSDPEEPNRVPSQAVPVEQVPLSALPIRLRHVFLLSNGHHTPRDIARMLHLPLDEVERFIEILHTRHLTIWQSKAS
ncbi:hypothetical protein [Ktedonobacter racemifer]|uniref:Uncharacterized protein n=1 Tax=Ktedonobacter racemifer DSM 44963 TaxID=485913 RepID=D6TX31_KTERA|nr:hypothetical protein [Ktedonobacter racemifer]EFH84764.1 hypothetical protein Krac_5869 [Ktedonobacter racemifer DSM 44963]